jgi:hypothetical protein
MLVRAREEVSFCIFFIFENSVAEFIDPLELKPDLKRG